MTDSDRIDWIEENHTLHRTVEFLYVVTGYTVTILYDDEPIGWDFRGETLRDAIDAAMRGDLP